VVESPPMKKARFQRLATLTQGAALVGLGVVSGASCVVENTAPGVVNAPVAPPAATNPTGAAPTPAGTAATGDPASKPSFINAPPTPATPPDAGAMANNDTDAGRRFPPLNAPRFPDAGSSTAATDAGPGRPPFINAPPKPPTP
jgi:hypothetical protein